MLWRPCISADPCRKDSFAASKSEEKLRPVLCTKGYAHTSKLCQRSHVMIQFVMHDYWLVMSFNVEMQQHC